MPRRPVLVLLTLLAAAACSQGQSQSAGSATATALRRDAAVEIQPAPGQAAVRVDVEVADDAAEQARGLMHRRLANDGEGMLFVFPRAAPRAFWMHDTPASLDLLFLDSGLRLVALIPRAEPLSDRVLSSEAPAQYVLEVPGGFAERHGIGLGARVQILRGHPLTDAP
jgi:uncharacterized protein